MIVDLYFVADVDAVLAERSCRFATGETVLMIDPGVEKSPPRWHSERLGEIYLDPTQDEPPKH